MVARSRDTRSSYESLAVQVARAAISASSFSSAVVVSTADQPILADATDQNVATIAAVQVVGSGVAQQHRRSTAGIDVVG